MTKKELINQIAESAEITKTQATAVLNSTIDAISGALAKGDSVKLIGFGTFSVADRASRKGTNPATGEKITIPASKGAKFKAGSKLTEMVA